MRSILSDAIEYKYIFWNVLLQGLFSNILNIGFTQRVFSYILCKDGDYTIHIQSYHCSMF